MARVFISPPYRGPTQGASEVQVDAKSVGAALDAVIERYPGLGELVFDADRRFHRFVKVFLNEDPVDSAELDKPLGESDRVEIVAAVAGG